MKWYWFWHAISFIACLCIIAYGISLIHIGKNVLGTTFICVGVLWIISGLMQIYVDLKGS